MTAVLSTKKVCNENRVLFAEGSQIQSYDLEAAQNIF